MSVWPLPKRPWHQNEEEEDRWDTRLHRDIPQSQPSSPASSREAARTRLLLPLCLSVWLQVPGLRHVKPASLIRPRAKLSSLMRPTLMKPRLTMRSDQCVAPATNQEPHNQNMSQRSLNSVSLSSEDAGRSFLSYLIKAKSL